MPRNSRRTPIETFDAASSYQRPLDWSHVVDAAAARLGEAWVRPDATGYMLTSGLADEFAATLCAYGMAAAEADHMHDRTDQPLVEPAPAE